MIRERIRSYFAELISLKTKPKDIARGVAIGIFIGFLPIWGLLQFFVALFFIGILRVNKIAIIIGTFITNPLTIPFIYAFCFKVGKWLLKSEVPAFTLKTLTATNIIAIAKPLLVGSIVVGLAAAILSYFITYYIAWFVYRRKKRAEEKKEEPL